VVIAMRYFTRRWYDSCQATNQKWVASNQEADRLENERILYEPLGAYTTYYEGVKGAIDPNVRQLMELWLHDVLVEDVIQNEDTLHLSVKFFWDRKRQSLAINIHFSGVSATSRIESCVGDEIIYTEIFLNSDGSYEYSALLEKTEIAVTFRAVVVEGEPIVYLTTGGRDSPAGEQVATNDSNEN